VLYTLSKGTESCTGQLINHERLDNRAIILSAEHCIDDSIAEKNPANFVFYFNFESKTCNDRGNGSTKMNVTGANILARHQSSDILLLQLKMPPRNSWSVFSTGWDARNNTINTKNFIGIHHPHGNTKAYSSTETVLESVHLPNDIRNTDDNHWKVSGWDVGMTETSSSGSCLWSAGNMKCIGVLTNATKTCRSKRQISYYGKLSSAWSSIKSSIDPSDKTGGVLEGELRFYEENDGKFRRSINVPHQKQKID
jgi:hypothetical protein